ncbi:MarR family winged helix-turn-helix transcriptional regulator [Vallitalea sp.]|jgi:DNA-binding MarR family transcriptional regulator|uniref:MarR family winged helix-turn-helix transcriptional regulator n=1 Tax=Vallitalea sp. TaxID=1882829 RepID=UPI0025FA7109|nr:MarR family transcriptional regulator [Vallitalea sp.]MCT4686204.1 MarR family transcriptional regulator [Vallitalea sp.]
MKKNMEEAIEKFMTMTEKISNCGKSPRNYGTDVDIYRSEIHIIKLIGDYANLHVSEIARKFGVTKGAISQSLKKLERKGLVEKYLDETNNTRLLVKLTDKGEIAYLSHEEHHKVSDKDILQYLYELSDHELEVVVTFIEKTSEMAERHL